MTFTIRDANPKPARFTRRGRPGGASNIHQIQIHATRGPTTMEKQVQATENWFANQPDRGGWGASADFVVGPDSREGGAITIVQFGDWIRTFGSWSAGYGSWGAAREWGAAEVGVAIEVAQPPAFMGGAYQPGDSNVPFTGQTLEAVAYLCGQINAQLEAAGGQAIPAVHIESWDQRRSVPIPRGYIGHDELANGKKLGKLDPGKMWNWPSFLRRLQAEGPLSPPLSNLEALWAAYRNGVKPLPSTETKNLYLLEVPK